MARSTPRSGAAFLATGRTRGLRFDRTVETGAPHDRERHSRILSWRREDHVPEGAETIIVRATVARIHDRQMRSQRIVPRPTDIVVAAK